MKSIILARVSTAEQKEAGNSLPSQLFRLERYTQDRSLDVIYRYEFDESAYKRKREEFGKILKIIKGTKDPVALCCDKVDRMVRNFTKDLVTLEEWRRAGKIELHFPSDNLVLHKDSPATDLFRFTIGVSLAKYYSDCIRDNVKRAFEQKLRNGEWIGPPRIGYILVRNEDGRRNHIPDPQKAHLIVRMFELYATGNYSFKTIKQKMDDLGLVGKEGKPLSVSMVAHILQDPFYYGIMVSRGMEYPHRYERLITRQLFVKCQEVRLRWNKKPTKYAGKPFLFRGLLSCARCGCRMTPEIKKGTYIFYSCTNARGICKRVYVPERELLEPVYETLRNLQLPQEKANELIAGLRAANEAKTEFHRKEIARLEQEYNLLQNRIDGLPALLLDGVITREVYQAKLKEWKDRQYDISIQIEDYTRADETYLITVSMVLNLARRALEIFESSEIPEKRQLLKYLLQNPRVEGKKLAFELKSPFDTLVSLRNQPIGLPVSVTFRTVNWEEVRRELEGLGFFRKVLGQNLAAA
jgi:site-specific DNA recombinase